VFFLGGVGGAFTTKYKTRQLASPSLSANDSLRIGSWSVIKVDIGEFTRICQKKNRFLVSAAGRLTDATWKQIDVHNRAEYL